MNLRPVPPQFKEAYVELAWWVLYGIHVVTGVVTEGMVAEDVDRAKYPGFDAIKRRLQTNNRAWGRENAGAQQGLIQARKWLSFALDRVATTLDPESPKRRATDTWAEEYDPEAEFAQIAQEMDSMGDSEDLPRKTYNAYRDGY